MDNLMYQIFNETYLASLSPDMHCLLYMFVFTFIITITVSILSFLSDLK